MKLGDGFLERLAQSWVRIGALAQVQGRKLQCWQYLGTGRLQLLDSHQHWRVLVICIKHHVVESMFFSRSEVAASKKVQVNPKPHFCLVA